MPTRVAIIGGGISGLSAADACQEEGLEPTVFETGPDLGGVWARTPTMDSYDAVKTNISQWTFSFSKLSPADALGYSESDVPWHLPKAEMGRYLEVYADKFDLKKYFRFNTTVEKVEPEGEGWKVDGEYFDKVIVATGYNSHIYTPPALQRQLSGFDGEIVPFNLYKNPKPFEGKRVLVIGCGFSGPEIAVDLGARGSCASVCVVQRSEVYHYEKNASGSGLPHEFLLHRRWGDTVEEAVPEKICGYQRETPKGVLEIAEGTPPTSIRASLAEGYTPLVYSGKVQVVRGEIERCEGKTVHFTRGHPSQDFDAIVVAAGFTPDLSFLPPEGLKAAGWMPDSVCKILLHKNTWAHPSAFGRNLAFVGLYQCYSSYIMLTEMQARWVAAVFAGQCEEDKVEEMEKSLDEEALYRGSSPPPQYTTPFGAFPVLMDYMAKKAGCYPEKIMRDKAHPLHQILAKGPVWLPPYRLEGRHSCQKYALKRIENLVTLFDKHQIDITDPFSARGSFQGKRLPPCLGISSEATHWED